MNKIDQITEVIYKIYFLLEQHYKLLEKRKDLEDDQFMTRQQVQEYLGISESTYKRKVSEGALKPMKFPGGDRFYKSELHKEYLNSIKSGKI
ncbi:helix-turn-helix domain-containing protein [Pedobacter sp. Leaf250]|uniref:helix-turn-helix domain-containing protein n=1 Tax=Pedobacter sp. Leaf250 TaxID=2876559 RepID=UPI001E5BB1E5|nr:helix-turn-helix domain-containing protein [Pedobacter sp. Leaf250]